MAYQDIGIRVILLGVGEFRRSVGIIRSDLTGLEKDLRGLNSTTGMITQRISALGNAMVTTGRALTLGLTLPIVGFGAALLDAGIDFEDAFAGVSKTVEGVSTGLYDLIRTNPLLASMVRDFEADMRKMGSSAQGLDFEQAMRLWVASLDESQKKVLFAAKGFGELTEEGMRIRNEFRAMALEIPIAAEELARVGQVAGELGVPAETIVEFTRVAALMGVATNLSADAAADAFGRFGNIFNISKSDLAEWSLSFGSTLVALGNATAGTESEITSMAMRVAASGRIAGLTEQQILGVSAAMIELGIKSERGGTAYSRILQEMMFAIADGGPQLEEFARIAGSTNEELAAMFKEDPTAAVQKFVTGFAKMKESGQITQDELDALNLTGVRVIEVMSLLGLANDTVNKDIEIANEAWRQQIALEEEAAKRFKTLKSQIQLAKNAFKDLGIQIFDLYRQDLENLVKKIAELITKFKSLTPHTQKTIVTLAALAAALGPLLVITGTFLLTLAPIIGLFGGVLSSATKLMSVFKLMTPVVSLLGKGFLSLVTALGPVGILVAVIGAAVAAYMTNFLGFKDFIDGIAQALKEGDFKGAANIVKEAIINIGETIKNTLVGLAPQVPKWLTDSIITPITTALNGVDLSSLTKGANRLGGSILAGAADAVATALGWAGNKIVTPIKNQLFAVNLTELQSSAKRIGDSILEGAQVIPPTAIAWVKNKVIDPLALQIGNVDFANLMFEAGKITTSILEGMYVNLPTWSIWVAVKIVNKLTTAFNEVDYSALSYSAGTIAQNILQGIVDGLPAWSDWTGTNIITPFAQGIVSAIKGENGGKQFAKEGGGGGLSGAASTLIGLFVDGLMLPFRVPTWIFEEIVLPFIAGLTGEESLLALRGGGQTAIDKVKEGLLYLFSGDAIEWVKTEVIDPFITKIKSGEYLQSGKDIAKGIVDGIKQGFIDLAQSIIDTFESYIIKPIMDNAVMNFIFGSPSKVTEQWGQWIVQGLAKGIQETSAQAVAAASNLNTQVAQAVMPTGSLANASGQVTTNNISNTNMASTKVFNPVYNGGPTPEATKATRSLYREWVFQG